MRKIFLIFTVFFLFSTVVLGQELPMTESYFVNKYALSPSYAGNSGSGYLFASYLQYWAGISGAPSTLRLSYNTGFKARKVGLGGNIIVDKAGVFRTFYGMGTYTYRVEFHSGKVIFGLSAGFIKSSVNFSEFMSNPIYDSDPALSGGKFTAKAKFISEFSALYWRKNLQAGLVLSNVNFGSNYYNEYTYHYSPFLTYQFHVFYTIPFNDTWHLTTLLIDRGGKNVRNLYEIGAQLKYKDRLWGDVAFRGENIYSFALGIRISKTVMVNYSYDFAFVNFNSLQIHELTLGIKL